MGRTYLYECPKCGYKARVAGKPEHGFALAVQTILCLECRQLHDAVVRIKLPIPSELSAWRLFASGGRLQPLGRRPSPERPPAFESASNRLTITGGKRFRWILYKPRCPVAQHHRVEPWTDPGKCPRCATFLERAATPYRIWD
jgi:hypothetical protein